MFIRRDACGGLLIAPRPHDRTSTAHTRRPGVPIQGEHTGIYDMVVPSEFRRTFRETSEFGCYRRTVRAL